MIAISIGSKNTFTIPSELQKELKRLAVVYNCQPVDVMKEIIRGGLVIAYIQEISTASIAVSDEEGIRELVFDPGSEEPLMQIVKRPRSKG